MKKNEKSTDKPFSTKRFVYALTIAWTLVITSSLAFSLYLMFTLYQGIREMVDSNIFTIVAVYIIAWLLIGLVGIGLAAHSFRKHNRKRQQAEKSLRESEERYRTLFESAPVGIGSATTDGKVLTFNDTMLQMMGYSKAEVQQINLADTYQNPEERALLLKQLQTDGFIRNFEVTLNRRDGTPYCASLTITPVTLGGEETLLTTAEDISDRKRTEEELRESEERYRTLVETMNDGLGAQDENGLITYTNDKMCKMLGYSRDEIIGRPATDFLDEDNASILKEQITRRKEGEQEVYAITWTAKDGRKVPTIMSPAPLIDAEGNFKGSFAVITDISERVQAEEAKEKLEEELRQAQKMEAVGQLAGGVAHDFNNLLQGILGYGSIALGAVPQDNPAHSHLEEVIKAGNRAAVLVRQLLTFSRRETLQPENVDLNDTIADLMKMLRRVIGEHIELNVIPGMNIGTVYVDPGQMEQVLMNLCVNARDAMPDGGRITIETSRTHLDSEFIESHPWAKEGDYVVLSVSDTGTGISPEIRDRIYEPFFTTKEVGEGTGLGLATVYAIVKRHGGYIDFSSEEGQGTTFRIYLPATEESTTSEEESAIAEPIIGGNETILLAEDDELVRNLAVHILETGGYNTIAARDGEEAIDLFDKHEAEIDMALLDVVMPKKNGRAVYDRIKASKPNLPVAFSTGYGHNILETGSLPKEGYEMISKPCSPNTLLQKVREILDKKKG